MLTARSMPETNGEMGVLGSPLPKNRGDSRTEVCFPVPVLYTKEANLDSREEAADYERRNGAT